MGGGGGGGGYPGGPTGAAAAGVNPALLDGKILKKTRPRRTVDYNGGLGRLMLVCIFFFSSLRAFASLEFEVKYDTDERTLLLVEETPA